MIDNIESYHFSLGNHHLKDVIWIQFPKDTTLIEEIKKLGGAKWSASQKCWYVPDTEQYRKMFHIEPKIIGKKSLSHIHETNRLAFNNFIDQMKLKGLSPNTIRTYAIEFASLLATLKSYPVDNLSADRLRAYFLYCIETLKIKENTLHSRMNAIKFYFEQVLYREKFFFEIPRPQRPSLLPKVIDKKDILKMLAAIENPKHQLMLGLCYGMGLRVSEIVNLKIEHIDSQRMQVLISGAKGKKDRYVNLPESLLESLRNYYKEYRPKEYLFEGQYGGQYSIRSVQAVFKNATRKAKINKKVGIHSLRHSYATHLMEYGTDTTFIQKLLGHNDIKTTQIYTHVSTAQLNKVKSPLDRS